MLLGGLLTAGPGWPWVFYVNVPIGLVIAAALTRMLPPPTPPRAAGPGSTSLGALLVTASSGAVIYALIGAGDRGWLTAPPVCSSWPARSATWRSWLWQRRVRSPLMDLRLLARRPVATGTFLILMATALMIAVFFLGTFYFQHARGYGALHTGLLFLPVALATMLGANLTGRVIGRVGAPAARRRRAGRRRDRHGRAGDLDCTRPPSSSGVARRRRRHRRDVRRRLGHRARPGGAARGRASPPASSARSTSSAPPSAPRSSPASPPRASREPLTGGFTRAFVVAAVVAVGAALVAVVLIPPRQVQSST